MELLRVRRMIQTLHIANLLDDKSKIVYEGNEVSQVEALESKLLWEKLGVLSIYTEASRV